MPALTERDLSAQLRAKNISTLYCIFGEETYLIRSLSEKLIKTVLDSNASAFNLNEFDCNLDINQLLDAIEALPLMSAKKCVVVKDFNPDEHIQENLTKIFSAISDIPETTTVLFYYPTLKIKNLQSSKWRNFIKKIETHGFTVEIKRRSTEELQIYLAKLAKRAGCELSKQSAGLLIEYVGNDMRMLKAEVDKLCAFANFNNQITDDMIETMVTKSAEATVFALSDALVSNRYETAYQLLAQLFERKEEPVAILATLSSAYVDMYRVFAAKASGKLETAPAEYGEYRGKEFRLKKASRNLRRISNQALQKSLHLFVEADIALKSSPLDKRLIMDRLIAKLLLFAQER